jgi:AraC-like DNA-binding protein
VRIEPVLVPPPPNAAIARSLQHFLAQGHVKRVYIAEAGIAPPVLAYVTHFPRLYVPISGCHTVQVAQGAASVVIRPRRGEVVFVPGNAWDKPDWKQKVQVLTFLFGSRHLGVSLVEHDGRTDSPAQAIKTNLHGGYDGLTQGILRNMTEISAGHVSPSIAQLLVECLLHSCYGLLTYPSKAQSHKANRTFESICLYVQENFQSSLTRQNVAEHFRLSPNHVSRLFRQQGKTGFHDYLNVVRINRAKFMLRNYNMTLKEVASNCGYSDVAYFCRVFKQATSATPTQYRQRH